MAFHKLDEVFTPDSLAEDRQAASQNFGLQGDDADSYIEQAIVKTEPGMRTDALQQNMIEPEKAQALSDGIEAAAQDPKNQGIGIVPAIFAGLAGAFSDNGVATATKLMDKWDPRTQAALASERQGKKQKVDQQQIEMDQTAQARDPESEKSRGQMKNYAAMFDEAGLPQLGQLFVGKSAEESDKLFTSLSPQMKNAIGLDERQQDRDIKQQNVDATRASTEAQRAETNRLASERNALTKDKQTYKEEQDAIKLAEQGRVKKLKEQTDYDAREQARQQELTSADATIQMFDNVIKELEQGNVQTGPLIEMLAPVGAEEKQQAGFMRRSLGAIRQAADPEVEKLNQVSARLNAEAKKLYDLGVMSKDDWDQMGKMSVSTGFDEGQNLQILKDQLGIIKKSKLETQRRQKSDTNPSGSNEGKTATGANGEKYIIQNGQWVLQ